MIKIPKRIKLVITDGDGTLYSYEKVGKQEKNPFKSSWDLMGFSLPKEKRENWFKIRDISITKMNEVDKTIKDEDERRKIKSKIEYAWFIADLNLLKGYKLSFFARKAFPIPYTKGAKQFFLNVPSSKIKGIVSAGIDFIIEKAARDLGMDFYICNKLHRDGEVFNGKGEAIVTLFNKEEHILKLCQRYNVGLENILYFGDHFNCVPVLKKIKESGGIGIAVNAKIKEVVEAANYSIDTFLDISF